MSEKDMHEAPRCQHVRLSGRQCKAPARRGNNYCLFHEAEHVNDVNLSFPPVEDAASVAVATDQVLQALRDDTIDFRRAGLLFSGLRIARANLKQLGLEMGDELTPTLAKPARVGHPDEDDLPGPSLAEILLERLSEMETENGMPPIDIAKATASGKELREILLERFAPVKNDGSDPVVPAVPPPEEQASS